MHKRRLTHQRRGHETDRTDTQLPSRPPVGQTSPHDNVQAWVNTNPSEFSGEERLDPEPISGKRREWRRQEAGNRRNPEASGTTLDDIARELRRGNARPIPSQVIQVNDRMSTAALEVLRSCRPTEKFEDIGGKVDLRSHLTHLQGTMSKPELTARAKLAEMKHWFTGPSLILLEPFIRNSRPTEETFQNAIASLEEHYAVPQETAANMLNGWLSGEKLTKKEGSAVIKAVYTLGNIWQKAKETNRHLDWDREDLYDRIIEEKFPFWISQWSSYTAKWPNQVIAFAEFESFLIRPP